MKFVPKVGIYITPALVQILAWHLLGNKPLSEPMMVSLFTHIYASLGLNELNACIEEHMAGPTFIKPDQRNPWIKDQIKITLLPTISHLLLPNFVSCGRDKPSHMTQNLVTVGAKLWTAERFLVDPWSMDYADPVW